MLVDSDGSGNGWWWRLEGLVDGDGWCLLIICGWWWLMVGDVGWQWYSS